MNDPVTAALFALSESAQEAFRAAKAEGDRELAQALHNMGWLVASMLARRAKVIAESGEVAP